MAELVRVLREDFAWDGYRLHFMRAKLLAIANRVTPTRTLNVVDDPDDDRILECAVSGKADIIVTGDKEMLKVGIYSGTRIIGLNAYLREWHPGPQ